MDDNNQKNLNNSENSDKPVDQNVGEPENQNSDTPISSDVSGPPSPSESSELSNTKPSNPNAKWYVVHTYSGHENKVAATLQGSTL